MAFINKTVILSPSRLKEMFRGGSSTPNSRGRNRSQSEDIGANTAHEANAAERYHPDRASDLHRRLGEDEEERQHSSPDVDHSDEKIGKSSSHTPRRFSRPLSRSRMNTATRPVHSW